MRTLIPLLFVIAVFSTGDALLAAQQADMVKVHLGHVSTSFQGTPDQQGLLPTAIKEAKIAAQHAALAVRMPDDLAEMKLHAGHVIHAIDPTIVQKGPGLNYGLKKAAAGVVQHIQLAAKAEGASKNVMMHAEHIATAAGNVLAWSDELLEMARKIIAAKSADEAASIVVDFNTRAQQLITGVDANGDGRTTWEKGEGGLSQAEMHMQLLLKGEGM